MLRRASATTSPDHPTDRRTRTRLLTAGTIAALATAPALVGATAETSPQDVTIRTVAVQPADRVTPSATVEDDLQLALAEAIEARTELVANEPEPEPAPEPEPEPAPVEPQAASAGVWDRLAQCESGGNWQINTGNGFYGGLQFTLDSWNWVGGSGMPHEASREEQIARAEILLDRQGWNAWPSCSRQLGLR